MSEPILTLGKILTTENYKDAVHIAIDAVIAAENLNPSDDIGLIGFSKNDPTIRTVGKKAKTLIGIVDPFLKKSVFKGQKFWMWLYPNTIRSLRHSWTHHAYDDANPMQESVKWLEKFAAKLDVSYSELMNMLCDGEGCLGTDTPDCVYNDVEEMWTHYELVTGNKVEDKTRLIFRCAC